MERPDRLTGDPLRKSEGSIPRENSSFAAPATVFDCRNADRKLLEDLVVKGEARHAAQMDWQPLVQ